MPPTHGEAVHRCLALLALYGARIRRAIHGPPVLGRHPCRPSPPSAAMLSVIKGDPESKSTANQKPIKNEGRRGASA